MSVVFDGQVGQRQFGPVSRYGRRAAEDLIALLGATAWMIQPAAPTIDENAPRRKGGKSKPIVVEEEPEVIALAKADFGPKIEETQPAEPAKLFAEPIADLDLSIFNELGKLDESAANDLFDLDTLGEVANQQSGKGNALSYDQAVELGLVPK
jgi:hypothetical protein